MKVFYIDPMSYAVLGKYDVNLLREMSNWDIDIEFLAHKNILKEEYMPDNRGYSVTTLFNYQHLSPAWQKALSYIFSYGKIFVSLVKDCPDVVHVQWTKLPLVDILFINLFTLLKIPVIYTCHNALPHNSNFFSLLLSKIVCQSVTRIIVHSKSTKDQLINYFGTSLDKRCIIIPYGKFDPVSEKSKISYDEKKTKNNGHLSFSIIGQIYPYKGIIEYLEIWSYALKNYNNLLSGIQLRIVGRADRDYFVRISDFIRDNSITNVFLDDKWLSDQEFEEELLDSDVCILPYLSMSQSGVLMTLLSYRKPCIVSDVGGLTDPFDVARIGWVFSWKEDLSFIAEKAIIKPILDIRSGWYPSSKNWEAIDQYFSWNRAGEATVSLYKELLIESIRISNKPRMNWKLKAKIQTLVGLLPDSLSYSVYYWMQRNFGSLKDGKLNPTSRLLAGIETVKHIEQVGRSPIGATFLELGTGRRINTPLAFWLLGAEKVVTVDLNPYLKEELVRADLCYIAKNKTEIEVLFENRIFNNRLDALLEFIESPYQIKALLEFLKIEYIAPGDASHLNLPKDSVDFHTSYTVLEHIPPEIIKAILKEGQQILKNDGLFIHKIDYSDHFSHSDKSISSINFLQFSDDEWDKIAGNRYMYMNRLRHDDFVDLFQDMNHQILINEPTKNDNLLSVVESSNFMLNEKFKHKSKDVLATTSAWFISE
jgi:SAM-dependent methyltransferase